MSKTIYLKVAKSARSGNYIGRIKNVNLKVSRNLNIWDLLLLVVFVLNILRIDL